LRGAKADAEATGKQAKKKPKRAPSVPAQPRARTFGTSATRAPRPPRLAQRLPRSAAMFAASGSKASTEKPSAAAIIEK
jgi:hypothetical protein